MTAHPVATNIQNTVIPVFSIVALGFALARWRSLPGEALSRLALGVSGPCFVYTLLATSTLPAGQGARLILGTVWMVSAGLGLVFLAARAKGKRPRRGTLLTVGFWNAGNLALSCSRLAFGDPGAQAAAIVFCTTLFISGTLGVWIASGSGGGRELLKAPLFYAAILGAASAGFNVSPPFAIAEPIRMLGETTIPLLLLGLGFELNRAVIRDLQAAILPVVLRMACGPILMFGFVEFADVTGVARKVLLLNSVMPAAVITVAMSKRYEAEPTQVASAVALGTILSLASIPFALHCLS